MSPCHCVLKINCLFKESAASGYICLSDFHIANLFVETLNLYIILYVLHLQLVSMYTRLK